MELTEVKDLFLKCVYVYYKLLKNIYLRSPPKFSKTKKKIYGNTKSLPIVIQASSHKSMFILEMTKKWEVVCKYWHEFWVIFQVGLNPATFCLPSVHTDIRKWLFSIYRTVCLPISVILSQGALIPWSALRSFHMLIHKTFTMKCSSPQS